MSFQVGADESGMVMLERTRRGGGERMSLESKAKFASCHQDLQSVSRNA